MSIILSRTTGRNELAFARQELFGPLGIRDVRWPADPQGNNYGWSDLQLHPLDMAKFGQLLLQRGRWNGRQIIPQTWIETATRAHVTRTGGRDHYGYFWWIPGENLPGVFEAVGRGGQRITIWPAKDLVLVFTGGGFDNRDLSQFILKALKSDKALTPNPDASKRLAEQTTAVTRPPEPQPISKLPLLVSLISGKTFRLTHNTVGLTALRLVFNDTAVAQAELEWNGRSVHCPLGLDGVERFSNNPLVRLPQAGTGQWLSQSTFLLKLDLVGAINCYSIKLNFLNDGTAVNVDLSERTGLNKEQFAGTVLR